MGEVLKKADISDSELINVDGENHTNLRFTDDVALFNNNNNNNNNKTNGKTPKQSNSESLKVGLKIYKGKTRYMTNHADSVDNV